MPQVVQLARWQTARGRVVNELSGKDVGAQGLLVDEAEDQVVVAVVVAELDSLGVLGRPVNGERLAGRLGERDAVPAQSSTSPDALWLRRPASADDVVRA